METKTLIHWTLDGRDRRLKRDDLDLRLYEFSGRDKDAFFANFGQALKARLLEYYPEFRYELTVPTLQLFEKCLDVLSGVNLDKAGYSSNRSREFMTDAVKKFLEEKTR